MGYSRVPTPEPRAYARPTALREGADDGTYIANADLPHHPIDPYESCEPLVLVLLVPDIALICSDRHDTALCFLCSQVSCAVLIYILVSSVQLALAICQTPDIKTCMCF